MPLGTAYPFGMRQIKVTPFVDLTLETLGAGVELPAAQEMSWTEAEDYVELRGNDKTITSRGMGAKVEWEMSHGGISLSARKIIVGGTVTDSGVTPNQTSKIRKLATDARPFFKAEGRAISDNGGDVHCVLFRCRATGDVEGNMADGEWHITSLSGEAFPSQAAAQLDALYDIIYNETETPIA